MALSRRTILARLVRRSPGWRAWIAVLAVTLAGAAATFCEDHDDDQGCAVCQLRHHSAADPSGAVCVGPADVAELVDTLTRDGCVTSDGFSRLPARGPPRPASRNRDS